MRRLCCGMGWLLTAGALSLLAQPGALGGLETQIRKAVKDPAAVLVVLDVSDKYHVFASSDVGEVTGTKVTLKAHSFALGNVELRGPEKGKTPPHDAAKLAPELLKIWKERPGGGNLFMKAFDGLAITGEIGNLKEEMTLELKTIVLVSKQK
ncbi:MAG: hypothetical protein ABSE56_11345 [Bryobacteraceae bacterium]